MPTGKRQHIVPQMMIRRFAGDDGKLTELHMPSFTIVRVGKRPREYFSSMISTAITFQTSTTSS